MRNFLSYGCQLTLKGGCLLFSIVFIVISFFYGRNVPFEKQWPLYDALRNTASIIFAVMGAWIALLYPEALATLFKGANTQEGLFRSRQIQKLLRPLIYSTIILASVLFVGISAPILKQIPILVLKYQSMVRGLSYAFLSILTILQLWSIVLTLIPADFAKQNIESIARKQSRRDSLMSQAKEIKDKD